MSIRLKRPRWAIGLCVPVIMLAAACGGGAAGADDSASKRFVMLAQSEPPRGLDPAGAQGTIIDGQYIQAVYGLLMYQNDKGEMLPGLAESATPNADLSQWTIKLRPNLVFSDNTPFTVDAIVAEWKRMQDPATASPARAPLTEVASTTVVDPLTLQVNLKAPRGTWNQALATPVGSIPSPTAVQAAGKAYGTTPETTVGAGPFIVTELQKGARYVYRKNPNYWDKPKPTLETLEIRPQPDTTSRANTFKAGGADMTNIYAANQDLVSLRNGGFQSGSAASPGVAGLFMRTDQGPTADVRVREALQRAIDIDSVIARAAPGAEKVTTLLDPDGPWANDVVYPQYDAVKAQQLIDAYLGDTGQRSVAVTVIGANTNTKVWEAFKQDWDKIRGLNVTLQIEENVASAARIAKRDYPNLLNSSLPETPALDLTYLTPGSSLNLSYLNDPELVKALQLANATDDVAKQKEAMRAVSERIAADVPVVVQYRAPFNWFWQKDVQGVSLSLSTGIIRFEEVTKGGNGT